MSFVGGGVKLAIGHRKSLTESGLADTDSLADWAFPCGDTALLHTLIAHCVESDILYSHQTEREKERD